MKPIPILDRLARIVDRHVRGPDYALGHQDLERLRVVLVDLGDEAEDAEVIQLHPNAPPFDSEDP